MATDRHDDRPPAAQPVDEFDEILGLANPNPTRAGCPPRSDLVAIAKRERPLSDPVYAHLLKCSPCHLEVRALQRKG